MSGSSVRGQQTAKPIVAYYTGSDTLYNGYALCYDHDVAASAYSTLSAADAARAAAKDRASLVEKPTLASLLAGGFAGIVVNAPAQGIVPASGATRTKVYLLPALPEGMELRDVDVFTDQSVTIGDILGPIPGTYLIGRGVIPGCAVFRANETIDRSATSGVCNGILGRINIADYPDKILALDDHFLSALISATADLNRYILTANSGTATIVETVAGGVLGIVTSTTGETSVIMNGEPWSLAAGKSIFMRFRVASSPLTAGEDAVIGLALYDVAPMASLPTDYIWFRLDGSASAPKINLEYVKDGTGGAVASVLGDAVSGTYYDIAMLITNKATGTSGQKVVRAWINQVSIAHTTTEAEVPDDELMTFCISALGDEATTLLVDRAQILMNL